jgi:hypothetical protein
MPSAVAATMPSAVSTVAAAMAVVATKRRLHPFTLNTTLWKRELAGVTADILTDTTEK